MKKILLIALTLSALVFSSCQSSDIIGKEEAIKIALDHASLTEAQVNLSKTKLDTDDGKQIYEIEFYTDDLVEYDYEIDAETGEIISFDADAEGITSNQKDNTPAPKATSAPETKAVTADDVKAMLLKKVPGATEADIREFESEYDDGIQKYEGEILYNNTEYEFEVNAETGEIISWESESIFD